MTTNVSGGRKALRSGARTRWFPPIALFFLRRIVRSIFIAVCPPAVSSEEGHNGTKEREMEERDEGGSAACDRRRPSHQHTDIGQWALD